VVARRALAWRCHGDNLATIVDEDVLQLPVAATVATGRALWRPFVNARPWLLYLENSSATTGRRASEDEGPYPAVNLAGYDDFIMLMRQRIVGGELWCPIGAGLCASRTAPLGAPPTDEVHGFVDKVTGVQGSALEGVIATVLSHLGDVTPRMIEGLIWSIPVEHLAAVARHVAGVE